MNDQTTIHDPLLGELTLQNHTMQGYFEIRPGEPVLFILPTLETLAQNRQSYRDQLEMIQREDTQLRHRAAEELLALYNDTWREEDESLLDIPTFMRRMAPINGITLYEEGLVEIFYASDEMFSDHDILIRVKDGQYVSANLAG